MKHLKSTLLAALLSFSLAPIEVRADEAALHGPIANVFATLSDQGIASSLIGKDLTADWRMMRVTNTSEQTALLRALSEGRNNDSPWDDLYYTRGDVISIADQTYLVAYRAMPSSDPLERRRQQQFILDSMRNSENQLLVATSELAPIIDENSVLSLSLISIGKGTNLSDIKAFNPAKDILTAKDKVARQVRIERSMSQTNLKNVALAAKQYIQDYEEIYPVMRAARNAVEIDNSAYHDSSSAPVQTALMPYVRNTEVFLHPTTGRPYLPNYKISKMNESAIADTAATFMFFEDAPDAEGMRNVAFVDGHVKAFKEAEFQRLRKAQGISESGLPSARQKGKTKLKVKPVTKQQLSIIQIGPSTDDASQYKRRPVATPPRVSY